MKKVALKDVVQPTPNKPKLSKMLDYLTDLGWEYLWMHDTQRYANL